MGAGSRVVVASLLCAAVAAGVLAACADETEEDGQVERGPGGERRDSGATDGSSLDGQAGDGSTPEGDAARDDAGGLPDAAVTGALFAFVGSSDGKIRSYAVDATSGAWTLQKTASAGTLPSFLGFDPGRRRVVAVDEVGAGGMVRSFAFEPAAGTLTPVNARAAGGSGTTHVSLDPTGTWALVANYTAGNMAIFPLSAAGTLGAAADTEASGAKSHWAGTNPSGTHVFVPSLGTNVIAQYTLNAATGALTANGTAALPANAGPRHLAFHPSEKWAYVINETGISVTTFAFDKVTGKLTAKDTVSALPPGTPAAGVSGAEIVAHPSGKYVYASTRGYNSIVQLTVDPATGTLTRNANALTGANRPRSFGMDPQGTLLYAGNQDVNQVVGFRIDAATGALAPLGKIVDVPGPAFVGLARMP